MVIVTANTEERSRSIQKLQNLTLYISHFTLRTSHYTFHTSHFTFHRKVRQVIEHENGLSLT